MCVFFFNIRSVYLVLDCVGIWWIMLTAISILCLKFSKISDPYEEFVNFKLYILVVL